MKPGNDDGTLPFPSPDRSRASDSSQLEELRESVRIVRQTIKNSQRQIDEITQILNRLEEECDEKTA